MSPQQKRDRMSRMRAQVREHNVYRWAGNLVGELTSLRLDNDTRPKPAARELATAMLVR